MSSAETRDHIVRRLLDSVDMSDVVARLANERGLQHVRALLPPEPMLVARAPVDPLSTIEVHEITVSVQRYGAVPLLHMSDLDLDKLVKAEAARMADRIDRLSQGTVADPSTPPATLTLEDLVNAKKLLESYGNWSSPDPRMVADSIMAECRGRGCLEIREEFDLARLQTVYTHIGPHYERTQLALSDRVLATGAADELRAYLRQWLRSIHGDAPIPDALDRKRPPLCWLCGQEREPDLEPVELEVPGGRATWGPMPLRKADREGFYVIEACSMACATAYLIRIDPIRSRPALGVALEERHNERERKLGSHVSDSTRGHAWNPWRA